MQRQALVFVVLAVVAALLVGRGLFHASHVGEASHSGHHHVHQHSHGGFSHSHGHFHEPGRVSGGARSSSFAAAAGAGGEVGRGGGDGSDGGHHCCGACGGHHAPRDAATAPVSRWRDQVPAAGAAVTGVLPPMEGQDPFLAGWLPPPRAGPAPHLLHMRTVVLRT